MKLGDDSDAWQPHDETRSAEGRFFERDAAAGALEHQPHECEADPGAVRNGRCTLAQREYSVAIGHPDPRSVVIDGDADVVLIATIDADEDATAGMAVLHRVLDQVYEHEREAVGIDGDLGSRARLRS
ncbi:MAG TPA: hypothetical protein VGU66_23290 [Candidatus Elarobacter sp.]|nr:hypothetical protein [Candidatus Elarobacter sp.]